MIDRSKFKATPIENLEKAVERTNNSSDNKRNYLSLKPGTNKFRIYPVHPSGGGKTFMELSETIFLEVEQDEYKNGEKTGAKIFKKKKIFNAKTHSKLKKDPIEEYLIFAENLIKENETDEDVRNLKLTKLVHYQSGIKFNKTYYVYAQRIEAGELTEFGLLELRQSMYYRLNQLAAIEGAEEVMGTDPFTDVVDGLPISITYDKGNEDPKKVYTLEILKDFDKVSKVLKTYPLSDEDLMHFEECESLYSLYRNCYRRRDFELALAGLKRFDEVHKLNVFAHDEFLDILDEISNQIPTEDTSSAQKQETKHHITVVVPAIDKKVSVVVGQSEADKAFLASLHSDDEPIAMNDEFDVMSRDQLKQFVMENEVPILVSGKMTDDFIKSEIRKWIDKQEEAATTPVAVEEEKPLSQSTINAMDKLAALRAKIKSQ